MFEKSPEQISVSKLRAILLLEVDFNAVNKIVFNTRLLPTIERSGSIPTELVEGHYSQSSLHLALEKKLAANISNQMKRPSIIISTDVTNYYNHIAYPISSITY